MVSSRRRVFLSLMAGSLVTACLSPTLPMPPPAHPDVEPVGQGVYELTGVIPEPGMVEALNVRTREIFGQLTERAYRFRVYAEPGDRMQMWYSSGNERSEFLYFRIPEALEVPDGGGDANPGDAGGGDAAADTGAGSDAP